MENISDIITSQIEANRDGLNWANRYKRGQDLAELRESLITNRIKLKRIKYAQSVNPAAAVFGESQVGKSYMVDCLLTSETSPLNIYDALGHATGFLESVNPTGGGREATSLISRFTTHRVWINDDYPVKCIMLSPTDLISVIVDSYFNDVTELHLPKEEDIRIQLQQMEQLYAHQSKQQDIITEDEIYELREYFSMGIMGRGEAFRESLLTTRFFETLAQFVQNISIDNWANVFSFLWNGNKKMTKFFKDLIGTMKVLDFSRTVYIKTDAVLREHGTLLHVDRLYELMNVAEIQDDKGNTIIIDKADQPLMDVLTEHGKAVTGIRKSEFCALAMEVDFTIDNPNVGESSLLREKPFLRNFDILDFPGARSRELIVESSISDQDACKMVLRGKVAYLFNKYSQQYLISNLLFCHHDIQSNVKTLATLLSGWVETTVGRTPQQRQEFINNSEISPLFIVGTKFNIDLHREPDDSKGSDEEILRKKRERWTKRFGSLTDIIHPTASNNWFNNWTTSEPYFSNLYLLRSFEYSCQDHIYEGYQSEIKEGKNTRWVINYDENGRMLGEQKLEDSYVDFFDDLKITFLEDKFVQTHFANPQVSWREVTEVRKDGSAWIIENLTRSGQSMATSRARQLERICTETMEDLCSALCRFYQSDDAEAKLAKALQDAGRLSFHLDILFRKDKYFFSEFIDRILVREDQLNDRVLETINGNVVVDGTDLSALFAVRDRAGIDNTLDEAENRRRMCEAYSLRSDAELDKLLESEGITMEQLINPPKVRNLARIIIEEAEGYWLDQCLTPDRFGDFVRRGLPAPCIDSFLQNLNALYRCKLHVTDLMTERVQKYVTAQTHLSSMAEMIADICAEMINKFVNTVGTAYFYDSLWERIRQTIAFNHFNITIPQSDQEADAQLDDMAVRQGLGRTFDVFDNVDAILNQNPVDREQLSYFSNYHAYCHWTDLMKLAYLATCDVPNYDVQANNALREVIMSILKKDVLRSLLSDDDYDRYGIKSLKSA